MAQILHNQTRLTCQTVYGLDAVKVGDKVLLRYKLVPRHVRIESIGPNYIKVFDLDKQAFRTFSIDGIL